MRLLAAKGVHAVGILWNVGCMSVALWALLSRFSDGVADAAPLLLLGAIGFFIAWGIAWLMLAPGTERRR